MDNELCEESDIGHNWVCGMMYVDESDVAEVARMRQLIGAKLPECEYCEETYVI